MRVDKGRQAAGAELGAERGVRVWQVDLCQPLAWVDEATAHVLAREERKRFRREIPVGARRRHVARAALRIALSRWLTCSPSELTLVRDPYGKPSLANTGNGDGSPHFNLSRSGDCCLIAVTTIGPIGVDVEHVVAFPELEAIVTRRFARQEADAILRLRGERRLRAFYNCWTRKEAYLKAKGMGLASALDAITVAVDEAQPSILALEDDDPDAWTLATIRPGPDLIGAVVVRGSPTLPAQVVPSALPLDLKSDAPV
jgi:4'-phosphopantetheinyl transferase